MLSRTESICFLKALSLSGFNALFYACQCRSQLRSFSNYPLPTAADRHCQSAASYILIAAMAFSIAPLAFSTICRLCESLSPSPSLRACIAVYECGALALYVVPPETNTLLAIDLHEPDARQPLGFKAPRSAELAVWTSEVCSFRQLVEAQIHSKKERPSLSLWCALPGSILLQQEAFLFSWVRCLSCHLTPGTKQAFEQSSSAPRRELLRKEARRDSRLEVLKGFG